MTSQPKALAAPETAADPEEPAAASRGTSRSVPLVLTLLLVLGFGLSRYVIADQPSEREYDEGVYLLSARARLAGHALFSAIFSSQPPAFLETLALWMRVFGDSLVSGRLLSLFFAGVSLAALGDLARRFAGAWALPVTVAALGLSFTFLDLGHVVQAELPALAFALLSLCAAFEARARGWSAAWLLASGVLLGIAALNKLFALPFVVPLGLLLLLEPGTEAWRLDGSGQPFAPRARRLLARGAIVSAGALAVLVLPLLVYDREALYEQAVAFHLDKAEAYKKLRLVNLERAGKQLLANLPVVGAAVVSLLLMLRRSRLAAAWILAWFLAMLAFLVEQSPLFWRHFVLLLPPLALAAGLLPSLLTPRAQPSLALALVALWIGAATAGPYAEHASFPLFPKPAAHRDRENHPLRLTVQWIRSHTRPGEWVVSDDPMAVYIAGREAPPGLVDTSHARVYSKSLTLQMAARQSFAARVVVLRREGRLSSLGGYRDWLAQHYEKVEQSKFGDTRSAWIRKDALRPASQPAAKSRSSR